MPVAEPFSHLKLSNIPLQNLREEFLIWIETLRDERFREELKNEGRRSITTPLFEWHGLVSDLLTVIVQRQLLGLEAYVIGAVWLEAGRSGILTQELNRKIRNPFSLGNRGGTAENYYNRLPSLLSPRFSLKAWNNRFWTTVQAFYREIRNPLFHGQQFETRDANDILPCISIIYTIYQWIATWHEPEVTDLRPRYILLAPSRNADA